MKLRNYFLMGGAVILSLLASSCNKEKVSDTISVDGAVGNVLNLTFAAQNAEAQEICIYTNNSWTITNDHSWITATPAKGSGNGIVNVTVSDNLTASQEIGAERTEKIYIASGTTIITVNIKQLGNGSGSGSGDEGDNEDNTNKYAPVTTITSGAKYVIAPLFESKYYVGKIAESERADDKCFSYIYATAYTADAKGKITVTDADATFTIISAGDGKYVIKDNAGYYLYTTGRSTTSLSTSRQADGSDLWAITFENDGTAKMLNAKNLYLALTLYNNTTYEICNYAEGSDKIKAHPTLFKAIGDNGSNDQAILPLKIATTSYPVDAAGGDVTVTIVKEAGAELKVTVPQTATWLTYDSAGSTDTALKFTATANSSAIRDAAVAVEATLNGVKAVGTITITQNSATVAKTIAELKTQIASDATSSKPSSYSITIEAGKEAVVTYVNGKNAFIEDETGAILYYKENHGLNAGDKISGTISGTGYYFNKLLEIVEIGNTATITAGTAPQPAVVTLTDLLASYDNYISRYIKIEGVEVTNAFGGDDRNGKIKVGTSEVDVYTQSTSLALLRVGTKGSITCIPSINNSNKRVSFFEDSHFEATEAAKYIEADAATKNVAYDATSVEIAVTSNMEWTATANNDATLSTTLNPSTGNGNGTINVTFAANTANTPKTATITIAATGATPATVTITQGAAPASGEAAVFYTFQTAKNASNTAYATNYNVTINGMDWSVPGNQNNEGFVRIGGKETGDTGVDREIVSKTAMGSAISKIVINHNGKTNNSLTVNSVKLIVASDAGFNTKIAEQTLTPTVETSSSNNPKPDSITFESSSTWATGAYYKIIINVKNTTKSNYGIDVKTIEFYGPVAN